jgi:hypothetical protein
MMMYNINNYIIIIIVIVLLFILQLLSLSLLFILLVLIIPLLLIILLKSKSRILLILLIFIVLYNIINKLLTNYNIINDNSIDDNNNDNIGSFNYDELNELTFIPKFPLLSKSIINKDIMIPTWIITNFKTGSSTIRFFDSSPFSPSNRYIAITRINTIQENKPVKPGDIAKIIVIDLKLGIEMLIDTTNSWDSQLGAQLQWGLTDNDLIYNTNIPIDNNIDNNANINIINGGIGIVKNIFTNKTRILECGIYHIR